MEKIRTTVRIAGREYTIASTDSEEYVARVAAWVDRRMNELSAATRLPASQLAVLVAVNKPLLHAMGMSGESYRIAFGMLVIYCLVALIRMQNWCMNDTYRAAGDSAFGSIMEIAFMFLVVQPVIHLANDYFHAPFLLVFLLCYVDEPIRYIIMQRHMYSGKWIKPVSDTGKATIGEFRKKHHIE